MKNLFIVPAVVLFTTLGGAPAAHATGRCPAGWNLINGGNTCQLNGNPQVIQPAIPVYTQRPAPAAPPAGGGESIPGLIHQGCAQAGVC